MTLTSPPLPPLPPGTIDPAARAMADGTQPIIVTSLQDAALTGAPGSLEGVDTTDGITLREAIAIANANGNASIIRFADALAGTVRLSAGELLLSQGATIDGGGTITLSGDRNGNGLRDAGDTRILRVTADATLSGLTLTGGHAGSGDGGAILASAQTTLTLRDTVLAGNQAARGGAVHGDQVVLAQSEVTGNQAGLLGGGIFGNRVTLTDSRITDNRAETGGGIRANQVVAADSLLSGNQAISNGGGAFGDSFILTRTVIAGNSAGLDGGGLWAGLFGAVQLTSSLVQGNVARVGGGVFSQSIQDTLLFTTLTENQASDGAAYRGRSVVVTHSTLLGNRSSDATRAVVSADQLSVTNSLILDNQGRAVAPTLMTGRSVLDGTVFLGASATGTVTTAELFAVLGTNARGIQTALVVADAGDGRPGLALNAITTNPAIDLLDLDLGASELGGSLLIDPGATRTVVEGDPLGLDLEVTATDGRGRTLSYGLAGADARAFTIDAASGVVAFAADSDFEAPADSDRDNAYQLSVQLLADGQVIAMRAMTVTVTDRPEVELLEAVIDFNDLAAGTVVSDQYAGQGVRIAGDQRNSAIDLAMIFNTAAPTGGDRDLASTERGGVLILSEDGDSRDPDDSSRGGTLRFTFERAADLTSIRVLDAERGAGLYAFDATGRAIGTVILGPGRDGDDRLVDLSTLDAVATLVVSLSGSGAVDDLSFALPAAAPPLGAVTDPTVLTSDMVELTLADATTDTAITRLGQGTVVDLASLMGGSRGATLTVDFANPLFASPAWVTLTLSDAATGQVLVNRTERSAPYALFGDRDGNLSTGRGIAAGDYVATITVGDRGGATTSHQTQFTVVDTRFDQAFDLSLVNTRTQDAVLITSDADAAAAVVDLASVAAWPRHTALMLTAREAIAFDGRIALTLRDACGTVVAKAIERISPYALFGDDDGQVRAGTPLSPGSYVLEAAIFEDRGGQGVPVLQSYGFQLIDSRPPPPANPLTLALVNTTSDRTVATLADGDQLDLSALGLASPREAGFLATVHESWDFDGRVLMRLETASGKVVARATERTEPYALFGDADGDFRPGRMLADGDYRLVVELVEENAVIASHSVAFTLI